MLHRPTQHCNKSPQPLPYGGDKSPGDPSPEQIAAMCAEILRERGEPTGRVDARDNVRFRTYRNPAVARTMRET
jgi:hypothetical protein